MIYSTVSANCSGRISQGSYGGAWKRTEYACNEAVGCQGVSGENGIQHGATGEVFKGDRFMQRIWVRLKWRNQTWENLYLGSGSRYCCAFSRQFCVVNWILPIRSGIGFSAHCALHCTYWSILSGQYPFQSVSYTGRHGTVWLQSQFSWFSGWLSVPVGM